MSWSIMSRAFYYGLFDGEQLIAFGGYRLILDEGHVINIAVHPAYRRQGYGELLMRQVIVACMAQGAKKMTLEVRKHSTPAQHLLSVSWASLKAVSVPSIMMTLKDDAVIMWLDMLKMPSEEGAE